MPFCSQVIAKSAKCQDYSEKNWNIITLHVLAVKKITSGI